MMRISIPGVAILLFALPGFAQTTPIATSDPQAVILAAKAMAALTGGVPITDVTLTGTATRTAGSDVEEGSINLKAKGTGESRIDLATSGGTRSDVRNSTSGPLGFWIGLDGTKHAMAGHNCLTDCQMGRGTAARRSAIAPHLDDTRSLAGRPNITDSPTGRRAARMTPLKYS